MIFAKINGKKLVKYPYWMSDLHEENPSSSYDDRFNVAEWYAQTDAASQTTDKVVEVVMQEIPAHDPETQNVVYADEPKYVNGGWVLGCKIVTRPTVEPTHDPE